MDPLRRVGQRITDLFAHPGGVAAGPMARVLNFVNREANQLVADHLGIEAGQRVLEVGFGGGAAIRATTSRLGTDGVLHGVDLSADMALAARRSFDGLVDARRLDFVCADVAALPMRNACVDHAYAIHSHLYWPAPLEGISEIRRVLRPGGRVLLAMDVRIGLDLIKRFGSDYDPVEPAELADLFTEAGLVSVRTSPLRGSVIAVVGEARPDS